MFLVSIIHKEAERKPCMDLAYKSSSAMAPSLQKYNESISSKKKTTKSRRITRPGRRILDQRKTSERPSSPTASVLHVPVSRSPALCLSRRRALCRPRTLSLSRGALLLSRSVCRPQILRRASKELPAFLEELPTTPRLPNLLITTLDPSAIYPLLLLFVPAFFTGSKFRQHGKFF